MGRWFQKGHVWRVAQMLQTQMRETVISRDHREREGAARPGSFSVSRGFTPIVWLKLFFQQHHELGRVHFTGEDVEEVSELEF